MKLSPNLKLVGRVGAFAWLCLMSLATVAIEFTEGDYYQEITPIPGSTKQVTEFFSFYCPHCFKQESFMQQLQAALPQDTKFVKNHVDGMPGHKIDTEQMLTKALIVADMLNIKAQMVPAIFNYIHVSHADFSSVNDVKNLFILAGVDEQAFDQAYASFNVQRQFGQMQKNTAALRAQGYSRVPTLIVNGKYKPVLDKIKSFEEYRDLILFLLNKTA